MKIEDQVCSLELSVKLKELGIKQESIFVWEYYDDQCYGVKYIPYAIVPSSFNKFQWYAAFTVAELGEILPINVPFLDDGEGDISFLLSGKNPDGNWWVNYTNGVSNIKEADARAEMLIHLIKNKLVPIA